MDWVALKLLKLKVCWKQKRPTHLVGLFCAGVALNNGGGAGI